MPLLKEIADKEHIIWDWNGTILNDVQHCVNTINQLLADHGLAEINQDYYKEVFEFPIKNYYDKLGFDYSQRSFEDLCHDFVDSFMEGFADCLPVEKIEKTLNEIKNCGKVQSVLSATDQLNLDKMISHFNYRDHFDYVYGIDNKFAASKLERGKDLIRRAEVAKEKTILIGDTIHDLEVGDALGIDVILLTHGHQSESRLLERHHRVISLW